MRYPIYPDILRDVRYPQKHTEIYEKMYKIYKKPTITRASTRRSSPMVINNHHHSTKRTQQKTTRRLLHHSRLPRAPPSRFERRRETATAARRRRRPLSTSRVLSPSVFVMLSETNIPLKGSGKNSNS